MAFNNFLTPTFLNPGWASYWWYTFGGDQGTQMATADVKTPSGNASGPAVHLADDQRKQKDNNGNATYFVRITNLGPGTAWHNLQGGGMS